MHLQPEKKEHVSLDAHPLLREYFARQLQTLRPQAWLAGHKRLYQHLCATTKEGKNPSLEDLQPLYQAVAHGCQAGMQEDACYTVYNARIQRGNEGYSTCKLGAFASDMGAVVCFFEQPWSRVVSQLNETVQAWLLNQAAYRLRALGRLDEAKEPMRAGLEIRIKQQDWGNAARNASNLSQLALMLGQTDGDDTASAVRTAAQSVIYADRSGDASIRMVNRTTHADALHQAGRWVEAQHLFQEAEAIQAKREPKHPLLYSVQGFRYADLLLAQAERSAWRASGYSEKHLSLGEALDDAVRRAFVALQIAERNNWLLDIALDQLNLGRAALYSAILQTVSLSPGSPTGATKERSASAIQLAVDGLRLSGNMDELPRGLLTRAWLRHLQGNATGIESAQTDLDEAWEITERGPMPLHMADIHLHRARLFMRDAHYPWDKAEDGAPRGPADDLREARRLIEKHGYGRRLEELQDAEEALRQWQATTLAPCVTA